MLALGALTCGAQKAGAAESQCVLAKIAEMHVTMDGMQPLVSAKLDGGEARFIADSGAFYSMISPGIAAERKFRLSPAPYGMTMYGMGGQFQVQVATIKQFTISGQTIPNVEFIVGGSETGETGLLGQNILNLTDTEYHLSGGVIRIMKPSNCGKKILAYWGGDVPLSMIDILPKRDTGNHVVGDVFVNGVKVRAMFDTGAGTSLLSLAAAKRAGITTESPGVTPFGMQRGLGRKMIPSWISPIASFKIGDEEIRNSKIVIADMGPMKRDYEMLIGADFFLSHRIYVANSQRKLYFSYVGGPVFNLKAAPKSFVQADPTAELKEWRPQAEANLPGDAEAYSRRGAAAAARRDYAAAIADFTKAIDMAPNEPRYLQQRAMARLQSGKGQLAKADLDLLMQKKPDLVEARMARATMHMFAKDKAAARADIDAASQAATKEADERFTIANLYAQMEAWDASIAEFDKWIPVHPADSRRPIALNGRCWARALLGRDLAAALEDCNGALKLLPKNSGILDSRALVRLRLGQFDKAIVDYDAALAGGLKLPWSMFGRGLAKMRLGQEAAGKIDIDEAIATDKMVAERAARYGIIASVKDIR